MASVATQSTALVQQRVAAKKVTRSARAVAPVRAAASNDAGSTRRQAVLSSIAAAGAALAPAGPALALSGFSVVKDTRKGFQFYYPIGWQEISVDGQDAVYKDVIEPLESAALNIYPPPASPSRRSATPTRWRRPSSRRRSQPPTRRPRC